MPGGAGRKGLDCEPVPGYARSTRDDLQPRIGFIMASGLRFGFVVGIGTIRVFRVADLFPHSSEAERVIRD